MCALTPFDPTGGNVRFRKRHPCGPIKGSSSLTEILPHEVNALFGDLASAATLPSSHFLCAAFRLLSL